MYSSWRLLAINGLQYYLHGNPSRSGGRLSRPLRLRGCVACCVSGREYCPPLPVERCEDGRERTAGMMRDRSCWILSTMAEASPSRVAGPSSTEAADCLVSTERLADSMTGCSLAFL